MRAGVSNFAGRVQCPFDREKEKRGVFPVPSTWIKQFLVGGTRSTPDLTTCSSEISSNDPDSGLLFEDFDVGTTSTRPPPDPTPRKVYLGE